MKPGQHWTKWTALVTLGLVAGACSDQSPTAVQTLPAPTAAALSTAPVSSVVVYPFSYTLKRGQQKQMIALARNASGNIMSLVGRTITWTSSNPAVASVSASGIVTAKSGGVVTIKATIGGVSGTAKITAKAPISVASVTLTPSSGRIEVGEYLKLYATPKDASGNPVSGQTVTWTSSNPRVAKVYSNGMVEALTAGSATISATAGGKTDRASITVTSVPVVQEPAEPTPTPSAPTSDVASVTVYPFSYALTIGQQKQMIALARNASGNIMSLVGRTITWTSSNPAVASVSASGVVKAKSTGVVTITAKIDGTAGTARITSALPY